MVLNPDVLGFKLNHILAYLSCLAGSIRPPSHFRCPQTQVGTHVTLSGLT